MRFTYHELRDCALREVKQRERVYPRLVEQRKMSATEADRQIAMMTEIAQYLEKRSKGERLL